MYRQWRQHLAGLCTNTLVSLGSLGSTLFIGPTLRATLELHLRGVAQSTD